MKNNDSYDSDGSSSGISLLVLIFMLGMLIGFQQWYSKAFRPPIEQPIGLFGLAEYYFRHPEGLFGL